MKSAPKKIAIMVALLFMLALYAQRSSQVPLLPRDLEVGPYGMMIVPVGQKERDAIVSQSQALMEKFERQIGFNRSNAASQ